MKYPPLKSLHTDSSLSSVKLEVFRKLSTEQILQSLLPGKPSSLKARPDGTLMEGHHRIKVLRDEGLMPTRFRGKLFQKVETDVDL